jgi:hypothetical protein
LNDAPSSQQKKNPSSEGITGWVADNVWAPVRDNVLHPVGNVGVQAANTVHVTDGINLIAKATNAMGLTDAAPIQKFENFSVPPPTNFAQRAVQDISSTAGSLVLYTAIAKGTSKILGGSTGFLSAGERSMGIMAEEQALLRQPALTSAGLLRSSAKVTSVLAKEPNSLLVGATLYNAARDPEKGETRVGNALGALAQFGVYRAANAKWSSSFSEQTGLTNKLLKVAAPRAITGLGAGLAQDVVSNSVSNSINLGSLKFSMGDHWQDNMGMNAAMNVVLPSILGGKSARIGQIQAETGTPAGPVTDTQATGVRPTVSTNDGVRIIRSDRSGVVPTSGRIVDGEAPFGSTERSVTAQTNHEVVAQVPVAGEALPVNAKLGQSFTGMPESSGTIKLSEIKPGDKVGAAGGTNPEFPGIDENDAVKRVVAKPNGGRVTIFDSGRTVIQESGQSPATVTLEGRWFKVGDDGKLMQLSKEARRAEKTGDQAPEPKVVRKRGDKPMPPDFSHLPENERPVNIGSSNGELIAKEMSNFEHSPFTLDGRTFQSVEGFYVWLKFAGDAEKQAAAQNMYSYEAKQFGKQSTNTTTEYDGKTITLGSEEHHALIKRAIAAKLEQHPDIARRFAETYPRPIIHDFGYPEPPSRLPAKDFAKILTDLRQDLVDGKLVTEDGPVSELSAKATAAEAAMPRVAISDAIRQLEGRTSLAEHPLARYAQILENSGIQVSRYLGGGAEHLAFETPDNQVLKVTTSTFPENFKPRQFHLHITDPKVIDGGGGFKLQLYLQPKGTPVSFADYQAFQQELTHFGYVMQDGGINQVSMYNGAVKLHDPFAAVKIPVPTNKSAPKTDAPSQTSGTDQSGSK